MGLSASLGAVVWQDVTMRSGWIEIVSIWVLVAVATVLVTLNSDDEIARAGYGAILAVAVALVSMIHLFLSDYVGFVKKLVYVSGGSFLMLAIASIYLFLR